MAISGGPDIVEDGLVLHIDAADRNSYAGLGPELVTNSNLIIPDDGNYQRIERTTSIHTSIEPVTTVELGKTYQVSWKVLNLRVSNTGARLRRGSTFMSVSPNLALSPGFYTSTLYNNISTGNLNLYGDSTAGVDFDLDYLSIRELPTSINNLTGNGNNGTFAAGTACPTFNGNNSGSFVFDGSNDYVSVGEITGSFSDFTILFWFYTGDFGDLENILDCNYNVYPSTGNVGPRFELRNLSSGTDKYLTSVISGNTSSNSIYQTGGVIPNGSLNSNTWYHAGLIKESSALYPVHNGTTGSAISLSQGFVSSIGNLQIGRGFHLGGSERYFSDKVTIVQIYNRPLSSDEILQNYNATKGRYGL